jgi:hydrogenase expression/formation protein
MDLEGIVRDKIKTTDEKSLENILIKNIKEYKDIKNEKASLIATSIIEEVKNSLEINNSKNDFLKEIIAIPSSNISMGKMGVGSRGAGDFFVHRKIAEIISSTNVKSIVNPTEQDDGGVVTTNLGGENTYITTAIDGIHSRLSDYPYLGGFHVTRATLRDICVMGAKPVAIISDLHLADDGDVGKLFDFTSGVSTVSELVDVPIVAGSTLRVGGDMVLGNRLVSAVGAIGVSKHNPTARKRAKVGDIILLTEGSGGGTITTTAIYNGFFDVIEETLDISFIKAINALDEENLIKDIHAMTDVTNGGLRGDAHEISSTTGLGLEFNLENINKMINTKVLNMLNSLDIDPLGVSIDSLMLIVPKKIVDDIIKSVNSVGVKIAEIGTVDNKGYPRIIKKDGTEEELKPLFRESAYTKVKKAVGETTPEDFEIMKEKVEKVSIDAIKKKEKIIKYINEKS